MVRVEYYVLNHDGQWKIGFRGKHYGPYANQSDAVHCAVEAASMNQGDAQVLVQGSDGKFRTEWTYGDAAHLLNG
jgi:Uncharacterized protein conserved in bacteria (DUF2188)